MLGAGCGLTDALYLKVSWGIGGAVFLGGRLRRGTGGPAGEVAHLRVRSDGPPCPCRRRGCLSTFSAGHALIDAMSGGHRDLDLDGLLEL